MSKNALIPALAAVLAAGACGRLKPEAGPVDAGGGTDLGTGATADVDASLAGATLVKTIELPGLPMASAYNAGTKKAYFACQTPAKASAGVAVVDDTTNAVVATITVDGLVAGLAANATTKKVYAAERDQIQVIDSVTDTVTATVKTPDGALIEGLAVDEMHDLVYAVATQDPLTSLYVLDGATNTMRFVRGVLLMPTGSPPIAVDASTQRVFVLGADSNGSGLIIAVDGVTGVPQKLVTSDSEVSATASGIVALGADNAAALFLTPNLVKRLGDPDVQLPKNFTPKGIAVVGTGDGTDPSVIIDGFDSNGRSQVHVLDGTTGQLTAFDLSFGAGPFSTTVAAGLLVATRSAGGVELYIDEADPKMDPPSGPAQTTKVKLRAK
jgi:hypothetical protein